MERLVGGESVVCGNWIAGSNESSCMRVLFRSCSSPSCEIFLLVLPQLLLMYAFLLRNVFLRAGVRVCRHLENKKGLFFF